VTASRSTPGTCSSPACAPPQKPCCDWTGSAGATTTQKLGGYENSWHWIRDTQLHEDKHRYRGNGAGVLATLRTAALNLLRLAEFDSIREGLHAVVHDIATFLAMAMQQRTEKPS